MDITKTFELDKTQRFDGEFNGVKYWFDAKTHKITPAFRQSVINSAKEPLIFAEQVSTVITNWSLKLGKAEFPPTAENMVNIPEEFVWDMFDRLWDHWSADEKKA